MCSFENFSLIVEKECIWSLIPFIYFYFKYAFSFFYFLLPIHGRESIVFGINFQNKDRDEFTDIEVSYT